MICFYRETYRSNPAIIRKIAKKLIEGFCKKHVEIVFVLKGKVLKGTNKCQGVTTVHNGFLCFCEVNFSTVLAQVIKTYVFKKDYVTTKEGLSETVY